MKNCATRLFDETSAPGVIRRTSCSLGLGTGSDDRWRALTGELLEILLEQPSKIQRCLVEFIRCLPTGRPSIQWAEDLAWDVLDSRFGLHQSEHWHLFPPHLSERAIMNRIDELPGVLQAAAA